MGLAYYGTLVAWVDIYHWW